MASYLIHMCVCDEVNKVIKKDRKKILIGSIAPDIAKLVGINRSVTHFGEYPEIDMKLFLSKYGSNLNDDFVLGYFIHLYTDYLWDKYFISNIYKDGILIKIDGSKLNYNEDISEYLYKDYDSLTSDIINEYNIDLSFLKEDIPQIDKIIEEVPIDKLNIITEKTNQFINRNIKSELNVMNMSSINEFVLLCKNKIINKLGKIV